MKPRRGRGRERQGPGAGPAPGKPPLKEAHGRTWQDKGDDPISMGDREMPPSQLPLFPKPSLPPGPGRSGWASPGGSCPAGSLCPSPRQGRPGARCHPAASGHAPTSRTRTKKIRRCDQRSEIFNIPEHPTRSFSLASRPWIFHAAVSKVSAKDAGQDKSVLSFLSLSVSPN